MIFDHVGWLVRNLDIGKALVTTALGAEADRTVDRPQWSLYGYYVGALEVFTFTDAELLDERLGAGVDAQLDHVAYAVDDIVAAMARLAGARFTGPDLREPTNQPFDLGNALHAWTVVDGLGLQLIEYRS
jgi:catechol 2,3-dioxygenase-like lactoylglutathione lyase family enzyme